MRVFTKKGQIVFFKERPNKGKKGNIRYRISHVEASWISSPLRFGSFAISSDLQLNGDIRAVSEIIFPRRHFTYWSESVICRYIERNCVDMKTIEFDCFGGFSRISTFYWWLFIWCPFQFISIEVFYMWKKKSKNI